MKKLFVLAIMVLFVVGCAATGGMPNVPTKPDVPAKPAMPDVPKAPAVPDAPKTPDVPKAPEAPKVPGTPASKTSMLSDAYANNNNPNAVNPTSTDGKYPGVSIKNTALAERLGKVFHDASAAEVEGMIDAHKGTASSQKSSSSDVQYEHVPATTQGEVRGKVTLKTDAVGNPRDDALPAYSAASGNAASGAKKDSFRPSIPNPAVKEKLNEIAAKKEMSITPRDDSGSSSGGKATSSNAASVPNPVQKETARKVDNRYHGVGNWK